MAQTSSAPTFVVPNKEIVAVEHPMVIKNIDNGLKTFGRATAPWAQLLKVPDYDGCLPLYLRPRDISCAPNLSHNAPTNNILLKITLPQRTGRKRKRGTIDSFEFHEVDEHVQDQRELNRNPHLGQTDGLVSHSRLDVPKDLQRRLRDCKDTYEIEAVGSVEQTHRYRGLSDYHHSTSHAPFMQKMKQTIMSGQYEAVKSFKLDPSMGVKPMTELIPPPILTDHTIPFNWGYHQNPTIKIAINPLTGQKTVYNHSTPAKLGTMYVAQDIEIAPQAPRHPPPEDPVMLSLIAELNIALEERPIWTRRAITNRVANSPGIYLLKTAIAYVGYQFRGGPWRDAIIKYGVDPRMDSKYRFYQTLFFKIYDEMEKVPGMPWTDIRSEYTRRAQRAREGEATGELKIDSHIFDGKSLSLDGKVWQVCDITDPMIQMLASTKDLRNKCDPEVDGWYGNGTWAKIKTVMRAKITAIRAGVEIPDEAFEQTLKTPDHVTLKRGKINVPVPDLRKYGVDDNPGREGVKRRRMRAARARWVKDGKDTQSGRKMPKPRKGKKKKKAEGDDDDDDDGEAEGTEEVGETTQADYELPKLRSRKGKEKVSFAIPHDVDEEEVAEWAEQDAEGDDDYEGHDDEEEVMGGYDEGELEYIGGQGGNMSRYQED